MGALELSNMVPLGIIFKEAAFIPLSLTSNSPLVINLLPVFKDKSLGVIQAVPLEVK